jgi:hypothetical protein
LLHFTTCTCQEELKSATSTSLIQEDELSNNLSYVFRPGENTVLRYIVLSLTRKIRVGAVRTFKVTVV